MRYALVILALALVEGACAQDDWGRLYAALGVTSDYRYNGVSYSDGSPALQGYLHWWRPDGFHAGLWMTGVEFDDPDNTSVEGDLYAGRNFELGSTRVSAEVLYTFFPDTATPGPTYDFLQLKLRAARSMRAFTLGASGAWTPEASYASGTAWRVALDGAYDINAGLQVTANAGRRWIERGVDRSYWDLGLVASGRHLSLDVRYVDTNLAARECGFGKCGAAVVATVMWRFQPAARGRSRCGGSCETATALRNTPATASRTQP
jgi:uncharacterized protein (TIGR02001 family)